MIFTILGNIFLHNPFSGKEPERQGAVRVRRWEELFIFAEACVKLKLGAAHMYD